MVVYNEIVAITAGAGLLGFAWFLADLIRNKRIESEGWAGFFAVTGTLLLVLGIHTTVTWPFGGDGFEYANIAFGQPAAGFGAALRRCVPVARSGRSSPATSRLPATALAALRPISVFVGALGLAMAVLAVAFVRFQLGAAPPEDHRGVLAAGQEVKYEAVSGEEARSTEPALSAAVGAAVRLHGQRYLDPPAFADALAASVRERRGEILAGISVSRSATRC